MSSPTVFKGVVIGEATRLRRNTTDEAEIRRDVAALGKKFAQRGYGRHKVSEWTGTVLARERICPPRYPKVSCDIPNFITHYTGTETPSLRSIITKRWNLVEKDPEAGKAFPRQPRITYRCGNIRDLLVRAKL